MKMLPGLKLIELKSYPDDRGFFLERYHQAKMQAHGILETFVQDNHSRSHPRVLRGLHYQTDPAQGKLVSVLRGSIWDVCVDLRKSSPTYGQWAGLELSESNKLALW